MIQYVLKRGNKYLSDKEHAIDKAKQVGDCKVVMTSRCAHTALWVSL